MMTSAFITSFSHSIFHGRTVSQTTNTQCPMSKRNLTFQPCRKCLVPIFCANQNPEPDSQEEAHSKPKFDPNSEKDAFGRDPRKETEFWMGAARSVLDSQEVKDAIANQSEDPNDNLTKEQREYMEFIKQLDDKSNSS